MTRRATVVVVVTAILGVVALAGAGASVWRADRERRQAEEALTTAGHRRVAARTKLEEAVAAEIVVEDDLTRRNTEVLALTFLLQATNDELDATSLGLLGTRARTAASDRKAAALDECLAGVAGAFHGVSSAAALVALRAAQPACTDALTAGTTAAFPFDFPDPSVVKVGALWYAYSTNAGAGDVQVLASGDRVRWVIVGNALPVTAPWAERGLTWAPVVVARPGGFALFYTARDRATGLQCTSVAASPLPQGPFVDLSARPLVCQHELGGSIDASPFVDTDGKAWLTWKSERPPTIWSRPLDLARLQLTGSASEILRATRGWEGGNVEAPSLLRTASGLFLVYSGNRWDTAEYAIGLATCAGPAGPCEKRGTGPALATTEGAVGPGGAEFFVTDQGPAIAYAAYRGPDVGYPASRLLHLAPFDPASGTFGPG